jgi:hypothetical protein
MKEKLTSWELNDEAKCLRMSIDEIRDDKKKYKEAIHVWIINHLADGVSSEYIAGALSIVFMKDYNIMLTAVNARKKDLNKKTTKTYNKPKTMKTLKFYTKEEKEIIKCAIESGDSLKQMVSKVSLLLDRPIGAISQKLYVEKRKYDKLKLKNLNSVPDDVVQKPVEIGMEVPHGMTFEGKPKKIMLHSDHFRIYF